MNDFLSSSIKRFREYKTLGEKAFDQIEEKDFHYSPGSESNSIAIIIRHMHGNMVSRWTNFLTEDGEKEWRKRDEEFESFSPGKSELLKLWNEGWAALLQTLELLKEDDLEKSITIRSQPLTVTDAILRQLAHYSYHVGQIVYLAKITSAGNWKSLSIPKGLSGAYNKDIGHK